TTRASASPGIHVTSTATVSQRRAASACGGAPARRQSGSLGQHSLTANLAGDGGLRTAGVVEHLNKAPVALVAGHRGEGVKALLARSQAKQHTKHVNAAALRRKGKAESNEGDDNAPCEHVGHVAEHAGLQKTDNSDISSRR